MLKNNGPKIDPCGTPKRILNYAMKEQSSLTFRERFES